jgi:hypothetical protein
MRPSNRSFRRSIARALAALGLLAFSGITSLEAQRPQPVGPLRRQRPPLDSAAHARLTHRPPTRGDYIAPWAVAIGSTAGVVGMVMGVRHCQRDPECFPIAGHVAWLFAGWMKGAVLGGAAGMVVGETTYIVKHRRF